MVGSEEDGDIVGDAVGEQVIPQHTASHLPTNVVEQQPSVAIVLQRPSQADCENPSDGVLVPEQTGA